MLAKESDLRSIHVDAAACCRGSWSCMSMVSQCARVDEDCAVSCDYQREVTSASWHRVTNQHMRWYGRVMLNQSKNLSIKLLVNRA